MPFFAKKPFSAATCQGNQPGQALNPRVIGVAAGVPSSSRLHDVTVTVPTRTAQSSRSIEVMVVPVMARVMGWPGSSCREVEDDALEQDDEPLLDRLSIPRVAQGDGNPFRHTKGLTDLIQLESPGSGEMVDTDGEGDARLFEEVQRRE